MKYTIALSTVLLFWAVVANQPLLGQGTPPKANDSTTPLHLLKPDYPVPYGQPSVADVTNVLRRVYGYLNEVTPTQVIDRQTGQPITDFTTFNPNSIIKPGDFRLTSYEWGVTYTGMLRVSEATATRVTPTTPTSD